MAAQQPAAGRRGPTPDDLGGAIVDIFRVQHGKIVERRDVLQPVPETARNSNTMF